MAHDKNTVKAMVERMRQAYNVDRKSLPALFGCKDGTINNWAHFGRVPYEQLEQCHRATGRSMDWLMFGIETSQSIPEQTQAQLSELIHRIIEDGLDFGAIAEPNPGGATTVASKLNKEILKLLHTEKRYKQQKAV